MSNSVLVKSRLSVKTQILAAVLAIVGAVAVPQLFHLIGAVSGQGTTLGEIFLPMHLPIILAGLLAGPYVGAIAGLLGPLVSFALSGMPGTAMLPFMMIELAVYGLSAGLLTKAKMPTLAKILVSQIAGRVVKLGAVAVAFYLLGSKAVPVNAVLMSVKTGLAGLVIQWTLLPLIIFWINNRSKNEQ